MYFVTHGVHRILFVENVLLLDGMDIDIEDLMLDIAKELKSNKDGVNKSDETIQYVNSSEDESGDIENKEDDISCEDRNLKEEEISSQEEDDESSSDTVDYEYKGRNYTFKITIKKV